MQKAYIIPNPLKDLGLNRTAQLIERLSAQGFEPIIAEQLRASLPSGLDPDACGLRFAPPEQAMERCDFALVVGGDGSILSVAAQAAQAGKPILGINMGTLGFMTELEVTETDLIGAIKQADFTLDKRFMLEVSVMRPGEGCVYKAAVLNEAVVNKGVASKAITLTVRVAGEETVTFSGDGVIVATPTGSTAYSLAAGGPILAPSSPCIAVTPICPLTLSVKSFVIDWLSEVVIEPHYGSHDIYLSPDGFESRLLCPGDGVVVRRAPVSLSLIRLKGIGFYQRIRMKLSR